jgi:ethanolamine utilization protein EutN
MEIARVVGSVSATLKDGGLQGLKLALVQAVDENGAVVRSTEVAVDTQSVGIGELVLIVRGSGARQPETTRGIAADLTIIAIVDDIRVAPATSQSRRDGTDRARRAATAVEKQSSRTTTRTSSKS